jgi:outer membrane receptor for ferrienterochelin and colicins
MLRRAVLILALLALAGRLPAQTPAVRRGRVVDAATGAPVAGAIVELRGLRLRTVTDSAGVWRLAVDGTARLRVRRLGYAPQDADATAEVVALTPLPLQVEDIVVSAARREQKLADAVPEISLLSQRDIEQSGASDVGGALVQATGVQLEGGVPAGAGVYLQGLGSQRVLILLDGQPMVGRLNGNFDLSRLPASGIERIEIVRGPQSTLYGSDAMGGVVNIITRAPTDGLALSLSALSGSQGRHEGTAAVSGTRGRLGLKLDGNAREESLAPGLPGDAGAYARRWQAAPKARWALGGSALEASGVVLGETQRYRTGQLFHFSDNTQTAGRLGWTWERGALRLAPTLSFSRFNHLSRTSTGAQAASDSGQRDIQQLVQGELTGSVPIPGGVADLGVQGRHESIRADRVQGVSRSLNSLETWAQGNWTLGRLSVTPGVRLATSQQWGSSVTPRLAAMVRASPALAFRGSIGAGYRVPDFKELYINFVNAAGGYAVEGNPNLRPERSHNVSLGVELTGSSLSGRVSAFRNRFTNFIDFGPQDAAGTFTYENIGRGLTRGIETEAGWTRGGTRLEAGYTLLEARDESNDTPLLGRARHAGRVSVSTMVRGANASATLQVTGRTPLTRDDATGAVTSWRASYARLDLRGTAPMRNGVSLVMGVENVFDRTLGQAWPGFTGRRAYGGLSWHGGQSQGSGAR